MQRPPRARTINTSISSRYTAVYSFHEAVRAGGLEERSIVKTQRISRAPHAAARLGLAEDAELFNLIRIRVVDGIRIARDQLWVPAQLGAPLVAVDFTNTALYWELRDHCGIVVTGGSESTRAARASAAVAQDLWCELGDPILELERLCYAGQQAVEYRETVIVGDRFALVHDFGGGAPDAR